MRQQVSAVLHYRRWIASICLTAGLAGLASAAEKKAASSQKGITQTGVANYYSDKMQGRRVSAKGERYNRNLLTAATHDTFPLGSKVKVTNLDNKKTVVVKVNDRMRRTAKPIADLSHKAAEEIGMIRAGHANVRLDLVE
jgi:rare lipoprotein A